MINAISQESPVLNSYGDIVDDIRSLVSIFQSFKFVFVHRSCNVVADALAKKAKCLVGSQEWSGDLPTDISQLVGFDVPWTILFIPIKSQSGWLVSKKKKKIVVNIYNLYVDYFIYLKIFFIAKFLKINILFPYYTCTVHSSFLYF